MSNVHLFPPQFVYSTCLKEHKKLKEMLFPKILEMSEGKAPNSDFWNCECFSSWEPSRTNNLLRNPFIRDQVVWGPVNELISGYLHQYFTFNLDPKLLNMWFNFYEKGYFQETHDHTYEDAHNILSGIYVLHLDKGVQNTTLFHSFNCSHYLSSSISTTDFQEGTVFLFPGSLNHEVKPSSGRRSTIAFNVSLDGVFPA